MLKNYFTIALRHLVRHRLFSLINIICLATGITFSLLIGVFVLNERGINADISNVANQYVIKSNWKKDNIGADLTTLGPLAKTMKDEYPALVANYYRFDPTTNIVSAGGKHFRTEVSAGDTTLVTMFGFKLLHGNPQHAFRNSESAVVTESFARKFFGTADVMEKVITIQTPADGGKHNFIITAVMQDAKNSITGYTGPPYEVYVSMENNQYFQGGDKGDNWANVYMGAVIELKDGITPAKMKRAFAQTLNKYQPPFVKGNLEVQLAPLRTYYLKQNNDALQKTLTTLAMAALFILLLAIINFININVGTAAYRLKEIGLRKVFGSAKTQLVLQYITEAMVLTFTATIISICLYEALLPVFNQILNTALPHFWQFNTGKISFLVLLAAGVGVLAGIYPAFVLSTVNTINAVKGKQDTVKGGLILRKALLVVQFALAITIFISTLNISKQVNYFFKKDIGYNKDQVIIISSLPRQWDSLGVIKMEHIKSILTSVPGVKDAALSWDIFDGAGSGSFVGLSTGNSTNVTNTTMLITDENFAGVYGIKVKEGIFLQRRNQPYQQGNVVLNESAVRSLKLTEPVAGKQLWLGGPGGTPVIVAGVVKDFNFQSLQQSIPPLIIANVNENFTRAYRHYSIKINTGNAGDVSAVLASLQRVWKRLFPETGFEYTFMDETFKQVYQRELQLKKAAGIATALNLIIVFMGIFGVVAFTLSRRTKEIAVRKVVGASAKNIINIFLKEYALLIALANIIAWPAAYLTSNAWLQGYAYRVHQSLMSYLFVCAFIFAAVCLLIIVQCFKAAMVNPVKSLRSE